MFRRILTGTFLLITIQGFAQKEDRMNRFIDGLLSKMTLDEKIGQLNLIAPGGEIPTGEAGSSNVDIKIKEGKVGALFAVTGVERIRRFQEMAVKESRLKIPLLFGLDIIHGYRTIFPVPLGLSCSWDTAMIRRSARVAATEATADGLCWTFSPMVDITRDPRWGRVVEGAGEDPFLGSQIARAMVKGYQGDNLAADSTLMACVKHFALYGAAQGGRDYNTTDMSRLQMYEYYLPPYKAALDAGAGSFMSSFNEIDGIPATANKWLLSDLLRKQWGFKGFVVTDFTGINEMTKHGLGDLQTVSALALEAGVDMDMVGEGFLTTLKKSLQEKKITQKEVDEACRRILEAKYKLGLFDDPFRYCNTARAAKEVMSADKRMAAREFAAHSFVLLKNNHQTLPLKKSGTIALIGPLANNKTNMTGTWAMFGNSQLSIPVLDGMKNVGGNGITVLYAKGANITDDTIFAKKSTGYGQQVDMGPQTSEQMLQEAIATANKADVIVAVVGESAEMSGESASRSDISLPESQRKLLEELAKTGKPLVVVMMSGRPLTIQKEVEQSAAFLQAWFGGHETGNAIADVLFGHYNPSGKLTMSFPRSVGQIPVLYNHKNTGRPQEGKDWQKFHSNYLDIPNEPLFPFGYGLSYTTFSYGDIQLRSTRMTAGKPIKATFTVTNTGQYDGEEVVQLYIQDLVASVTQPVKKLKAFQKIFLKSGESRSISFTITEEELKFFNSNLQWISEAGDFKVFIGTSSDNVKETKFFFSMAP
jgi:beta-glucosidase